ncbi:sugar phosphate isomerase/epimerase family protein [Amphibacillus marinus]|uniref:sugar phosphate isomerase/epimerase family protein n=1 Tax=Amphibacillus marinus TaxID=872970 RepID=UPI003184506F
MNKLNIGIRAHDIENKDLLDLTKKLAAKDIHAIQFALKKSIKEWPINTESLNTGLARTVATHCRDHHIDIAVLGCYINMIHPNLVERQDALDYFKAHIRFARDFDCSIVASETGSVLEEIIYTEANFTEEAFELVVASVQELVNEAERFGVIVGIEGGINHPIYSPQMMQRLIERVPSHNLQVIFDPVNYLTLANYEQQTEVIDEAFELFGDRIVIVHAKDFIVADNQLKVVPVGHGRLDYPHLISKLHPNKPCLPILLEETQEPHISASIDYLKNCLKEN